MEVSPVNMDNVTAKHRDVFVVTDTQAPHVINISVILLLTHVMVCYSVSELM